MTDQAASQSRSDEAIKYESGYHGHGRGVVVTQPRAGEFEERPMTQAELLAREPAYKIASEIYRHANQAGACYYEFWTLIAKAIQSGMDTASETKGDDPGRLKIMTALVERAYGIFTASGVLRAAEQDSNSYDPIVAWASDVRSILYRNKPAEVDALLDGIRRIK